jgi:glycosyltransferase involved in cell wall biosynthesis
MQNHHDVENVVIDGASTDDTLKIVESYADTLVHVISILPPQGRTTIDCEVIMAKLISK